MTQTNKTARKPAGAGKASSAKRDAYDEFLDLTEGKNSGTSGSATPSKRKGAAKPKASAGTAAKKSQGKVEYEADLEAAWGELTRESKRREEVRKANARRKTGTGNGRSARRPASRNAVMYVDNRPPKDDYDAFLEKTQKPAPPKRKVKRRRGTGVSALLLAGILCVGILAGVQYGRYRNFLMMKAAVEHQGFYEGATVEGVDVSGMTLEQAVRYWEENIESGYVGRTVTLSNGASFSAGELGYASDFRTVLTNAWSAGRSGSLEERYAAISERAMQPVSYTVTRSLYNGDTVSQCVAAIASQIDRPAQDAKIASFDSSNYTFQFTDEVVGSKVDTQTLAADMIRALEAGGGTVELPVQAIQPSMVKADIASQYGLIASAVTNASSSKENRLSNIRLALQMINGTCLKPGETFSFNDVVGERTTERGFKSATAYSSGKVVEEVGGGICQVSTTLFNAVVKADLDIVERHNHSLTVSYVDKGKDAAVNWGGQDLRFTNTSDDNVYICCFLSDDKRVRVGVFGKLLPNGEKITVEAKTTGTIDYETVYQPNNSLASGSTQVTQSGKNGYTAVAYKVRWDANGNQIGNELLCKSSYRATQEIIEYGP